MDNMVEEKTNAGYYFDLLRTLNADSKLDLISLLSQSLKTNHSKEVSLESLFGAYKSEETAEEIIAELRAARNFDRKIESLD